MKFTWGSIAEVAIAAMATTPAGSMWTTTATAATALWRIGFALFATVATAFGLMLKPARRVAFLIFSGMDEFLIAVAANNHFVFVHNGRSSGRGREGL